MRAVRWTLISVGGTVVLLAAAVFVITSVIDPNRYRGAVMKLVGEQVGRPLVIEGDLQITWFPWLGVKIGAAHLAPAASSAASTSQQPPVPLIEWESATVAAKLLPLVRGRMEVGRVQLKGLHVHLRRDTQGHGNWEGLGARPTGTRPAQEAEIAGIDVRDGTLSYVDEATGLQVNLTGVDISVGAWRTGQPLPVDAEFLARVPSFPPAGIRVQMQIPMLSVVVGTSDSSMKVSARGLAIKLAGGEGDPESAYNGPSRQKPRLAAEKLPGLRRNLFRPIDDWDAVVRGDMAYERTAAGMIGAHGSVSARTASLRKLAADLGFNPTMPPDPATLGELQLTSEWSYAGGALVARPIVLKLDGVNLQGWVQRDAQAAGWRFELHGDRVDLDRYVNVDSGNKNPFELETLHTLNANGSVVFDEVRWANAHLSNIRLRVETPARPEQRP